MTDYLKCQLNTLNKIFLNSIQKNVTSSYDISDNLDISNDFMNTILFHHQKTIVQKMKEKMFELLEGKNRQFSRFAILADPPNSGKTLSILAFLTSIPSLPYPSLLNTESNSYFYTFENLQKGCKEINVILVPNYLLNQWKKNIELHTKIKSTELKIIYQQKNIHEITENIKFVLLSNKMYKYFYKYCITNNIIWNTLILDQINNLYFSSTSDNFFNITKFAWFVTSDWIPLIFKQSYFSFRDLHNQLDAEYCDELRNYLTENLDTYYNWHFTPSSFFKSILPFNNPSKTNLVIKTHQVYLEDSIKSLKSKMNFNIIQKKCRPTISISSLREYMLSTEQRLDNSIPLIFQDLNVPSISYQDILPIRNEDCVICLDKPKHPVLTMCCRHIYCGYCCLKNSILRGKCPLCRSDVSIHEISKITYHNNCNDFLNISSNIEQGDEPDSWFSSDSIMECIKNKKDTCIEYIQKYKDDKILLYSQHKNIYYNLHHEQVVDLEKITDIHPQHRIFFVSNLDLISGLKMNIKHILYYSDFVESSVQNKILNLLDLHSENTVNIVHFQQII